MNNSNNQYGHAVVIGASVAGLLTAGAVSTKFQKVTIIERDQLLDTPEPRKGVPQGNQIHALLPAGLKRMCEIFPGFREDLLALGGRNFDEMANIAVLSSAGWRVRVPGQTWVAVRRPLIDMALRRRVLALGNVSIQKDSVSGLVVRGAGVDRAVKGVTLRDGSIVEADLVISATGRRTVAPNWLAEHGVEPPRETFVKAFIGYSTQFVKLPEDAFEHGIVGLASPPWPGAHCGVALFPADNGVHALAAVGAMKNYPPKDREGILEYLKNGTCPISAAIAARAEPVSDVETYHMEGSLMRHWDKVSGMPDRFLVVGDSVGSMNPVFGQGMTLAATAASLVKKQLDCAQNLDGITKAIQTNLGEIVATSFALPASVDACYEGAEWSEDFKPMTQEEMDAGWAMEVLSTQNADVSYAVSDAIYDLRLEDLGSPFLNQACAEWLDGDRAVPPVNRDVYPSKVESRSVAAVAELNAAVQIA